MQIKFLTLLSFLLFLSSCGENPKESNPQENGSDSGNAIIDGITESIKADPENALLYADRASVFFENEGYDEAILDLQKALALDSSNLSFYHLLADVYLNYYQSQKALSTLEKAIALSPESIPTLLKLSNFQYILTQYEPSMRTIDKILRLDPQNADAYFLFGLNFMELEDRNRAINSFKKAVEIDPEIIEAWLILGEYYEDIDLEIAEQYFDNALRVDERNVVALHSKADFLSRQNDLNGAIALYRRINLVDQQYETAYFNSGLLYLDMDSLDQAYRQFDLTVKFAPTHARAYYYRGIIAQEQGKLQQAKSDYEQALALDPEYGKAQRALEALGNK